MNSWFLGGSEQERLEVEVLSSPVKDEGYEWVSVRVSLKVGGFSARFNASFLATDFVKFRNELQVLSDKLKGNATFETVEGQLRLKLGVDKLGHITVAGEVSDEAGIGNKLIFNMNIDQSYLPHTIRQLGTVIEGFRARAC